MSIRGLVPALLMASLGCWPGSAAAFVDEPIIIPPHPTPDETIEFTVRSGGCHGINVPPPPNDAWRNIEIVGDVIRVEVRVLISSIDTHCNYLLTTRRISVGALPSGNYRLELYGYQTVQPDVFYFLAATTFQVGDSSPALVPTLNLSVVVCLAMLTLLIGFLVARPRFSEHPKEL